MNSIFKITPSSITLKVNDKTVKVFGESFVRGFGSSDFIIDTSSIKKWDSPHDDAIVTETERQIIVQYLMDELARRNWVVEAE